jgi:hypothetical protein
MPNLAGRPAPLRPAALPHEVALPDLSLRVLGRGFAAAFDACCRAAARAAAGEGWTASPVHHAGLDTSYVFRFARPMASLRFSAEAGAAIAASRHGGRTPHAD